jgi:ABC-type uncharacterized transport system YnjBCD substrate-binding protein
MKKEEELSVYEKSVKEAKEKAESTEKIWIYYRELKRSVCE